MKNIKRYVSLTLLFFLVFSLFVPIGFAAPNYYDDYYGRSPYRYWWGSYDDYYQNRPTPAPAPAAPAPGPAPASGREVVTLAPGTPYATDLVIIKSGQPGPALLVVGGVHGNEEAGYMAAKQIKNWNVTKGTLLVIPEANKRAIAENRRFARGEEDLNRQFPMTRSSQPSGTLAKALFSVLSAYDVEYLVDLHEGVDYYRDPGTDSVGQTLIYQPNATTTALSSTIVNELNAQIPDSQPIRKFTPLKYPAKGSLARSAAEVYGIHSFIFETSEKQSLAERISFHQQVVDILLRELGMK